MFAFPRASLLYSATGALMARLCTQRGGAATGSPSLVVERVRSSESGQHHGRQRPSSGSLCDMYISALQLI